jgi:Putative restriction endonuclease
MATTDTAKWTYDDLVLLGDDRRQHEIIDGEHYVNPKPNIRHQTIVGNLHVEIAVWLRTHPIGRVWVAPVDVLFSDFDVVELDIVYVSNDRAEVVRPENIKGAPDLVVEVLSYSNRRKDEITKRKLYENARRRRVLDRRSGDRSHQGLPRRSACRGAIAREQRHADDATAARSRDRPEENLLIATAPPKRSSSACISRARLSPDRGRNPTP